MASCSYLLPLLTLYSTDIARSINVISCLQSNCKDTTINCPDDGDDCFISCSTPDSCNNAIINCPKNKECVIICDDVNSCKGSTFNGQYSSTLDITGCNQYQSCVDLTIYCPQYTTDMNCFIEGNDNLGSQMTIYAVNGWNDIDIDYNGTFNNNLHGTMYCDTNYNISCNIASDEWSCVNANDICNNINHTSDNNDTSDSKIEMIIIVTTLIITFCFISLCCWYNNKNRKKTSTNTDSHTMQNIVDGNNTFVTSPETSTNANKIHAKGEMSKSKSANNDNNTSYKSQNKSNSKSINNDNNTSYKNQNKSNRKQSNKDIIIIDNNKHSGTHSTKPNAMSMAGTATATKSKTKSSQSTVNSTMSVEIVTDVDNPHKTHGNGNKSHYKRNINRYQNTRSDINMVNTRHNNEYKSNSHTHSNGQEYDKNRDSNKDRNRNKIKQQEQQEQQQQRQMQEEQPGYDGNGDDNIQAINADINQRNNRREKQIQNISVQENKNANDEQTNNNLAVINENETHVILINKNLGDNMKLRNREQLQFKPNTSDSDPYIMKSPDTWDNFEKENGILDDQFNMSRMMGYLEEGAIACSYE